MRDDDGGNERTDWDEFLAWAWALELAGESERGRERGLALLSSVYVCVCAAFERALWIQFATRYLLGELW